MFEESFVEHLTRLMNVITENYWNADSENNCLNNKIGMRTETLMCLLKRS